MGRKISRQKYIEGAEPEQIREVEDAALNLISKREALKSAKLDVDDAIDELMAQMDRFKVKKYRSPELPLRIELCDGKRKVKVQEMREEE